MRRPPRDDEQVERVARGIGGRLQHRAHRQDAAGSAMERKLLERHSDIMPAAAVAALPGPQVDPAAVGLGQIDGPGPGSRFQHGRDMDCPAEHVAVFFPQRLCVFRKVENEGPHHRHAGAHRLARHAVEIGKHAVSEFKILARDRLHCLAIAPDFGVRLIAVDAKQGRKVAY